MNISTLERIKRADADRLRPGELEVNGEKIDVLVKTFPLVEFKPLLEKLGELTDDESFNFISGLFFDPATREPLFSVDDVRGLSAPITGALMTLFRDVNLGIFVNRKN